MVQLEKIDHVQICIPKEKEVEARAFYSGIMGLWRSLVSIEGY